MNLTPAELFRTALPGGTFLVVVLLVFDDTQHSLLGNSNVVIDATIVVAGSLLAGALIHAFHRALIYPFLVLAFWVYWQPERLMGVTQDELDHRKKRTELRKADKWTSDWLDKWGDKTHFLWASAWAIWAGIFVPASLGFRASDAAFPVVPIFGSVIILIAWIDDMRFAIHHNDTLGLDRLPSRKYVQGACVVSTVAVLFLGSWFFVWHLYAL